MLQILGSAECFCEGRNSMEPTLSKLDYRFNPRTRVGCDIKITITAPHPTGFNPRTARGDVCYRTGKLIITSFNPRTSGGAT